MLIACYYWLFGFISVECDECGLNYPIKKSNYRINKKYYCSVQCSTNSLVDKYNLFEDF